MLWHLPNQTLQLSRRMRESDARALNVMTMTRDEYIESLKAEVCAFRQALTKESDRGCALFAIAYLEKALSDLLYVSVVYGDSKKMEKDLFDFNSPLATF